MKIFLQIYMICICFSCTFAAISTIVDNKGASPVVNCYFLYYNYKKMFSGMRHAAGLFRRLFLCFRFQNFQPTFNFIRCFAEFFTLKQFVI